MSFMMADIFIKAFILLVLMKFIAKDEADLDFMKITLAVTLITVGGMAIEIALLPYINAGFILINVGLVMFVLMKLCWLSARKAFQVTIPFMLICGLIYLAKTFLLVAANQAVDQTGGTILEQDRNEGLEVMRDINNATARAAGATEEEIAEMDAAFEEVQENLEANDPKMPKFLSFLNKKDDGDEPPAEAKPARQAQKETYVNDGTARVLPMANSIEGAEAKARLNVTAKMRGRNGEYLAAVNGDLLGVGDIATVEHKGMIYKWRLKAVTKDGVEWEELPAVAVPAPPTEPTAE